MDLIFEVTAEVRIPEVTSLLDFCQIVPVTPI